MESEKIKAFDPRFGWGVVSLLKDREPGEFPGFTDPIIVEFADGSWVDYTRQGAVCEDEAPVLAFNDYTKDGAADFVTIEKIKERQLPKEGDWVWVRDHNEEPWVVRCFAGLCSSGHLRCYENQRTMGPTVAWMQLEKGACAPPKDNS